MSSEQLSLDLGMAWNGYSPRSLTRGAISFTFQAGTGRLNLELPQPILAVQLELFPEGTYYGT